MFHGGGEKGLDALYNMDFAVADGGVREARALLPDHPVSPFLHGLLPVAMQLSRDDSSQDAAFLADMEKVIARCDPAGRR